MTTVRKGGIEVERVRLGKSELKVSPTAFGTWSFGGDWGRFDTDDAKATIGRARELGINRRRARGAGASGQDPSRRWMIVGAWRPVHLEDTAAAADIVLAPEDLAEIDYVLVDATAVWGPHPERMPAQDGGTG